MSPENPRDDNPWRKLGLFGVIVADLVGCTGAGFALGYWGNLHWGFPGWIVPVCTLVGLCLAMVHLYFLSKKEL
jgi:hypothetical protein